MGSDVFQAMVNQYLSHSMPKSAGNPRAVFDERQRQWFEQNQWVGETSP
jgi:hypothetical protein